MRYINLKLLVVFFLSSHPLIYYTTNSSLIYYQSTINLPLTYSIYLIYQHVLEPEPHSDFDLHHRLFIYSYALVHVWCVRWSLHPILGLVDSLFASQAEKSAWRSPNSTKTLLPPCRRIFSQISGNIACLALLTHHLALFFVVEAAPSFWIVGRRHVWEPVSALMCCVLLCRSAPALVPAPVPVCVLPPLAGAW